MNNKKVMLFKEAAVKSFQLLLALVKKKVELISINSREKKGQDKLWFECCAEV